MGQLCHKLAAGQELRVRSINQDRFAASAGLPSHLPGSRFSLILNGTENISFATFLHRTSFTAGKDGFYYCF